MLELNREKQEIAYKIPLTTTSGKIRVKERSVINEYGVPVATRLYPLSQRHYIEWQIGYDLVTSEINEEKSTTLPDKQFVGANGKTKSLFELSEIIHYFVQWGVITKQRLENTKSFIVSTDNDLLMDVNPDFVITRSHPISKQLFGINFEKSNVSYPLLIHKFGVFEIITEIIIKEKQRAVGVQPMLYLCFPITELVTDMPLLNRVANPKETAKFVFSYQNASILLDLLKIFGILSSNHKRDVLAIRPLA